MIKILIVIILLVMGSFSSHIDVKGNVEKALTTGIYIYKEEIKKNELSSFIIFMEEEMSYENSNYHEISDFTLNITYEKPNLKIEFSYIVNYFLQYGDEIEVYII